MDLNIDLSLGHNIVTLKKSQHPKRKQESPFGYYYKAHKNPITCTHL